VAPFLRIDVIAPAAPILGKSRRCLGVGVARRASAVYLRDISPTKFSSRANISASNKASFLLYLPAGGAKCSIVGQLLQSKDP